MRTIVIGDIHGCLDEFIELLGELQVDSKDRIILLGDLIDRGPDPAGVVELAYNLRGTGPGTIQCVMGNHEEKALRWRRHESRRLADPTHYKNPMAPINQERLEQWRQIPDEHWSWIATWPTYIRINENFVGVHAGCIPEINLEKQKPNELMRLRYLKCTPNTFGNGVLLPNSETYKMASLKETGEPADPKSGETVVHWTEKWTGPDNIVYGHFIWDKMHHTTHPITRAQTFGIDTGCVHGGDLTALVFFPTLIHTCRVKAHKTYSKNGPWNEE